MVEGDHISRAPCAAVSTTAWSCTMSLCAPDPPGFTRTAVQHEGGWRSTSSGAFDNSQPVVGRHVVVRARGSPEPPGQVHEVGGLDSEAPSRVGCEMLGAVETVGAAKKGPRCG